MNFQLNRQIALKNTWKSREINENGDFTGESDIIIEQDIILNRKSKMYFDFLVKIPENTKKSH